MSRALERWLDTFMCGQYAETFDAYGYKTLQSLCQLDYQKLRAMGVMHEHCEKIMENVSVLQQSYMGGTNAHSGSPGNYGPNPVMNNSMQGPPPSMDAMTNPASTALVNVARNANSQRGSLGFEGVGPGGPGPGPYMNNNMGQMPGYPQQNNPMAGNMMPGGYSGNQSQPGGSAGPAGPAGYYNSGVRPVYNQPTGSPQSPYPSHPMTPHMSQAGPINVASPSGLQQSSPYNQYNQQHQQHQQHQQQPNFMPPQSPSYSPNYPAASNSSRQMASPPSVFPVASNSGATTSNPPIHHHMRNSHLRQNPQQVADSILQMASSTYPGGGQAATRGPHPMSRYAMSGPASPLGPMHQVGPNYMSPGSMGPAGQMGPGHMGPEGQGGVGMGGPPNMMQGMPFGMCNQQPNQYMGYPPGGAQMNCGSPVSPMQVRSPGSVHSNHSLPSTSPGPMRSPAPCVERPSVTVSSPGMAGMGSPNAMHQQPQQAMQSPMGCGSHASMRSPMQAMPPPMSPHNLNNHTSPAAAAGVGVRSPSHSMGGQFPNSGVPMMSSEPMPPSSYPCSTSSMYIENHPTSSIYTSCNNSVVNALGQSCANPLMSLQKLVMLPESQVVDPKSVVNDANLSEGKMEDEKGDRRCQRPGESDDLIDNYIPDIKQEHSEFALHNQESPFQSKNSHTRPPKPPDKQDELIANEGKPRGGSEPNLTSGGPSEDTPPKTAPNISESPSEKPKKQKRKKEKSEKGDTKNDVNSGGDSDAVNAMPNKKQKVAEDAASDKTLNNNNNNNEKGAEEPEKPRKKKKKVKNEVTVGRVEESVFLQNNIFRDKNLPSGLEKVVKLLEKSKELPLLFEKPLNGKHVKDIRNSCVNELNFINGFECKKLKAIIANEPCAINGKNGLRNGKHARAGNEDRAEGIGSPEKENHTHRLEPVLNGCAKVNFSERQTEKTENLTNGHLVNGDPVVDPYEFEDSLSDLDQQEVCNSRRKICKQNGPGLCSSVKNSASLPNVDSSVNSNSKSPVKNNLFPKVKKLKRSSKVGNGDTQKGSVKSKTLLTETCDPSLQKSQKTSHSGNSEMTGNKDVPILTPKSVRELNLDSAEDKVESPPLKSPNPKKTKRSSSKAKKTNSEPRDSVLEKLNGASSCRISTPLSIDCSEPSPIRFPSPPVNSDVTEGPKPLNATNCNAESISDNLSHSLHCGLLSIDTCNLDKSIAHSDVFGEGDNAEQTKEICKSPKYCDPLSKNPAPEKEKLLSPTKRKLAQLEFEQTLNATNESTSDGDHVLSIAVKKSSSQKLSSKNDCAPKKGKKKKETRPNSNDNQPMKEISSNGPSQVLEPTEIKKEVKEKDGSGKSDMLLNADLNMTIKLEFPNDKRLDLVHNGRQVSNNNADEPSDKNEGTKSGSDQSGSQKKEGNQAGATNNTSSSQVTTHTRSSTRCRNASQDSSSGDSNKGTPQKDNRTPQDSLKDVLSPDNSSKHSTPSDTSRSRNNLTEQRLSSNKPQRKRKIQNFALLADQGDSSDSDEDLYSIANRIGKQSQKNKMTLKPKMVARKRTGGAKHSAKDKNYSPEAREKIPSPVLSSPRASSPRESIVSISSCSSDPKTEPGDPAVYLVRGEDQATSSPASKIADSRPATPGDSSNRPKKRIGRPVGAKDKKARRKRKRNGLDFDTDEETRKTDMLKKAVKLKDSVKKVKKPDAGSGGSGPSIRIKGTKSNPSGEAVVNGPDVEADKKKRRGEVQYEKLDSSLKMSNTVPWLCAFCHMGPNYGGLGDLFGPYYIGSGDNSPKKRVSQNHSPERKKRQWSADGKGESAQRNSLRTSTSVEEETLEKWTHAACCIWSHGVYMMGSKVHGLQEALADAHQNNCSACKATGATLGCVSRGCTQKYHYLCAHLRDCFLDEENFSLLCPKHKDKKLKELENQEDSCIT